MFNEIELNIVFSETTNLIGFFLLFLIFAIKLFVLFNKSIVVDSRCRLYFYIKWLFIAFSAYQKNTCSILCFYIIKIITINKEERIEI